MNDLCGTLERQIESACDRHGQRACLRARGSELKCESGNPRSRGRCAGGLQCGAGEPGHPRWIDGSCPKRNSSSVERVDNTNLSSQ